MKRAIILFWHGLTGILTGIANWITEVLGMKDDSRYGNSCVASSAPASPYSLFYALLLQAAAFLKHYVAATTLHLPTLRKMSIHNIFHATQLFAVQATMERDMSSTEMVTRH